MAAPATLQRGLVEADEVLGLLLDLDLAVAQNTEDALPDDFEAGEEMIQEEPEQLLHRQEAHRLAGQPDEAADRGRDEQQRLHVLIIAAAAKLQGEAEAKIGDERKGVRGIDGERRQYRKDLGHELLFEPSPVARQQVLRADDGDTGGAELGAQRAPRHLLVAHQLTGPSVDRRELLRRRQAILARRGDLGEDVALETGDADHVEFIEVARRNRQESQPLEQGMPCIVGLAQNPLVEGEPREFAVDEARLGLKVERHACRTPSPCRRALLLFRTHGSQSIAA